MEKYLVVCSYAIAILDLLSAVLFASVSGMLYAQHHHWTSLAALAFAIIWICLIIVLLLGIYRRQLNFVRYWLVFTCLGIMLDAFLLLYGLTLAVCMNWEGVKLTVMPFAGLEMTFVFIIYVFYLDIIESEQWIPLRYTRFKAGCSLKHSKYTSSSAGILRRERKRLRKMYTRDEKAAFKEPHRKLRRGQP
ncbi:uncharacterized protein LOC111599805 isoform X2 [Drosophila hydei]|uniref:Uncharacterized protein LOC111599805 isoform X2 n=1 Tax=Drosophila hydei TaxID=7224 RepID=A0A6J1LZR9_DROHY|nr:uncharacterized protein LOC111599805 isoform X2 [Drosophila hydei]